MLAARKAANLQLQMRSLMIAEPVRDFNPRYIAGVDVSVRNGESRAAVVTVDIKGLLPVETATAAMPVSFPYVPGLLAFQEAPVILEAFYRLKGGSTNYFRRENE